MTTRTKLFIAILTSVSILGLMLTVGLAAVVVAPSCGGPTLTPTAVSPLPTPTTTVVSPLPTTAPTPRTVEP